ncbi:hypothetical protein L7F22_039691 [Adiantum nelumboides]|nr:hypothetical protein [Adiantum nelumboides]
MESKRASSLLMQALSSQFSSMTRSRAVWSRTKCSNLLGAASTGAKLCLILVGVSGVFAIFALQTSFWCSRYDVFIVLLTMAKNASASYDKGMTEVAFLGSIDPCFNMLHADVEAMMRNQATKGSSDSNNGTPRKGKSSTQESLVKTGRWIVPRVALPTQTKFCFTKEDFRIEYGLCMVDRDPKLLCDDDFSNEEWLRVWLYKCHQKEKMHLKGLRPEMYEECLLLYHKVYQGALPNNKVGVHFAHGFTWQKCKGAEDFEGLVAWAVYAEGVIKILHQQKTLNRKLEKWRSTNGPCLASEWKFNAKNMPNYTESTGTGFDWQTYSGGHQFLEQAKKRVFGSMGTFGMSNVSSTTFSASTADVAAISNMKANAVEKLKEKQQCLKAIKIALDQSKTKRDEQVGLMRGTATIIERLNKDMEEHKLHKAGLVPNKEAMAKLETLIQIRKEVLKDMGLDIEVHNLDNLGEEAAQLQVIDVFIPYDMKLNVDSLLDHFVSFLHVIAKKHPMEGIFGSAIDGIAHSQAGSSRKPNIDSMCGGCGDKNASQTQASEDTPDQQKAKKGAEKRADVVGAQDTTVNLSDEDADLLILDVCGEILWRRKKRSNTEERATPKKKAKVASKPPEPTPGGGKKSKEPSSAQKKANLQAPNLKPPKPNSRKKLL